MGLLINGIWHDKWYDTTSHKGAFVREPARFRHWVTADGAPDPSGKDGFVAEAGRYHLYVSLACPWAHRTLIFRQLKQLQGLIGVSVVSPKMLAHGWEFSADEGLTDHLYGLEYLYQLYLKADANYSGRVTVPVLWDKQRQTIVSNESAEIIRMFNSAFDHLTGNDADFYPANLRDEIDTFNERIYHSINNGVYRCGFATSQDAYEAAFDELFAGLDWLDGLLSGRRFLCGKQVTEADWRLFTTLIRFDAVYVGHFKANRQRIADYPHLSGYLRDLYQLPGIAETVNFDHIKCHYYFSHTHINPTQVIPKGPALDLDSPPARACLSD